MFSCARARSSMIFEARHSGRRCTTATLEANFERKIASSIAESPADDHRRRVLEEGRVAGGAVAHAPAPQLLLAGHPQPLVLGAHREDHGARAVLGVAHPHGVHARRARSPVAHARPGLSPAAPRSARPARASCPSAPAPSSPRESRGSSRRRSSAATGPPTQTPRPPAARGWRARCTARRYTRRGHCR